MTTSESEPRLLRALGVSALVMRCAQVVQLAAIVVFAAGMVVNVLNYDDGGSGRFFWTSTLYQLISSGGWAGLLLCGSAVLRLLAVRLELDVASRYDTDD